jgi:hypothetical protein
MNDLGNRIINILGLGNSFQIGQRAGQIELLSV